MRRADGEGGKDIELGAREPDQVAADARLASPEIDLQITDGYHALVGGRARRRAGAPQHGPHPRDELTRAEGLGHVVVRTDRQPHERVELVGPSRQHHHVAVREGSQLAAHLQAIDSGKAQV